MKELKRTQVGKFKIEQAIKIEEVSEKVTQNLITFEKFFEKNEAIILNKKDLKLLYNGVKLNLQKTDGIYKVLNENNEFQCVGVVENHKLKRDIWLNNNI